MIPEITITCSTGKVFINNITVEQYKKYAALMEKNGSDKITDALFFNKRIIQEIFGNRMSLDELGEVDVIEFLTASKGIHFIMQDIVSDVSSRRKTGAWALTTDNYGNLWVGGDFTLSHTDATRTQWNGGFAR